MDDQVQHEDANNLEVAGNQELGVNHTENQEIEEDQNTPLILLGQRTVGSTKWTPQLTM